MNPNSTQDHQQYLLSYSKKSHRKPIVNEGQKVPQNQQQQSRKRKSLQFYATIVKQKKQRIFNTSRQKHYKTFLKIQMETMLRQLNTEEKKKQFIKIKGKRLVGEPQQFWINVMNELLWSLKCFRKKGNIEMWVQSGIISQLCLAVRRKYQSLNLAHQAAELLSKLMRLQPSLIPNVIKNKALYNVMNHSTQISHPLSSINNFIEFMTTILVKNPKQFILQLRVEKSIRYPILWLSRMIKQNKFDQKHANIVYRYLYILMEYVRDNGAELKVQQKYMRILFETLDHIVEFDQQNFSYSKIFQILLPIFETYNSDQPTILRPNVQRCVMFIEYKNLQRRFLEMIPLNFHSNTILILTLLEYKRHNDRNLLKQIQEELSLIEQGKNYQGEVKGRNNEAAFQIIRIFLACLQQLFASEKDYRKKIQKMKKFFIKKLKRSASQE